MNLMNLNILQEGSTKSSLGHLVNNINNNKYIHPHVSNSSSFCHETFEVIIGWVLSMILPETWTHNIVQRNIHACFTCRTLDILRQICVSLAMSTCFQRSPIISCCALHRLDNLDICIIFNGVFNCIAPIIIFEIERLGSSLS